MFSWLKGNKKDQEAKVYGSVIDGVKDMYRKKLLPLERSCLYGDFHSPYLNSGDFEAKPMVLLIGQYSTGKTTFIRYLLERDFPGIRIGPEPTTDRFVAIMHGPNEQVTPGNALAVDPSFQFKGLDSFGNAFLSRLEGSFVPCPVLESITLVDTPGILSGEKQRLHRGYDFEGVIGWFSERSDMIILLFDAHKLDISDEFRRVIEIIKKNHSKIRIVLNKSDMITTQQLMRVYGALMWSLGKVLGTPEVIRVYIGSFWDKPLQYVDNQGLFEVEQEDLFADIQRLPRTAAVRKLDDLIKRARLAKVQAMILNHLRNEMPSLFGKQAKKDNLIENLDQVFNSLHKNKQIPIGDFPSCKNMREKLAEYDFTRFPKLNLALLDAVDQMLAVDISRLSKMLPKEEEALKDKRIKGGAFGFTDEDPFSTKRDLMKPSRSVHDETWIVAQDSARYDSVFTKLGPSSDGKISGNLAREEMMKSKLPSSILRRIWALSDIDQDGQLDRDEFCVAMFLIDHKLSGNDLPDKLPPNVIPPSKKNLRKGPDKMGPSSSYTGGRDYQEGGDDSYRRDGSGGSSGRNYREEDSYRSYGGGRDGESSYSVSGGRNYMGGGGRALDDHNDDSGGLGAFVDS